MSSSKNNSEEKGKFQPLTPQVIEDGKADQYIEAIEFSVDNPQIKNIALTGSYGAGKSSVLLTYEKKFPEHDYLKISLAAFNKGELALTEISNQKKKVEAERLEDLERLLEISILQQIFYHVKHEAIPDSRFKRIMDLDRWNQMTFAAGVVAWLAAVWYLFLSGMGSLTFTDRIKSEVLDFSMIIIFFSGIFLLVQHIRRIYNNSKVNKMNIHNGEFEVDKDVDRSVLNKHLDELIYFFEVTKFDVVIIEDLDRFDNIEIFSKLREINLLLNNSLQIGRKISFIYAVRDDMFSDDSRTKFFDFVIPIIPATDPSNAGNILIDNFKKTEVKAPSDIFLREVSSFINDMRFLRNVFNEYVIYYRSLDGDKLVPEKIFGMMLYKNFFPDDFMALQRGEGNLHRVIHEKSKHINSKIGEVEKEIKNYKEQIRLLKKGISETAGELRAIYISYIHQQHPNAVGVFLDNTFYTFPQLNNEEVFAKFREAKEIFFNTATYGNRSHSHFTRSSGKLFEEYEKSYDPELNFDERLDMLMEQRGLGRYKEKIALLEEEKRDLKNSSLPQLLKKVDVLQYFQDVKHPQLVNYLLKQGHIDESYYHYISKFVEGTLTFEDNEYKKAVLGDSEMAFDYPLKNISNLVKELEPFYFDSDAILNFNLVDFLLKFRDSYPDRFYFLKKKLQRFEERTESFLDEYVEKGEFKRLIFKHLIVGWPEILGAISRKQHNESRERFTRALLEHVDNSDLERALVREDFDSFLEENENFLSLVRGIDEAKIKSLLEGRNVFFPKLEKPEGDDIALFEYLVTHNHYYLNAGNIKTILGVCGDNEVYAETFEKQPYTTIEKCGIDALKKYVEKNWDYFVEHFILTKDVIEEEEGTLILLLNDERIELDDKKKIIANSGTVISDLLQVEDDELQEELLLKSKVLPEWSVLEPYYEAKGKTEGLVAFLNEEDNYDWLPEVLPQEKETHLSSAIIEFDDLSLEAYKQLVEKVSSKYCTYCGVPFENLQQEKVEWLVENGILALCDINFKELKEYFPGLEIKLVEVKQEQLSAEFDNIPFDENDLEGIISSNIIRKGIKREILPHLSHFILNNKLAIAIPDEYLMDFVRHNEKDENKIQFVNLYEEKFQEKEIREIVEGLGGNFPNILEKGRRYSVPENEQMLKFSKRLEELEIARVVHENGKLRFIGKGDRKNTRSKGKES